jgi:hypothetical protein
VPSLHNMDHAQGTREPDFFRNLTLPVTYEEWKRVRRVAEREARIGREGTLKSAVRLLFLAGLNHLEEVEGDLAAPQEQRG